MKNCPTPFNKSFEIPFPVEKNVKILKNNIFGNDQSLSCLYYNPDHISECLDAYSHRFIIRYFNYLLLLPGFEHTTYFMTVQLVIHSTRFPLK